MSAIHTCVYQYVCIVPFTILLKTKVWIYIYTCIYTSLSRSLKIASTATFQLNETLNIANIKNHSVTHFEHPFASSKVYCQVNSQSRWQRNGISIISIVYIHFIYIHVYSTLTKSKEKPGKKKKVQLQPFLLLMYFLVYPEAFAFYHFFFLLLTSCCNEDQYHK